MKTVLPLSFLWGVVIPVLLWMAFTPWSAQIDLAVTRAAYGQGAFEPSPFWDWVYVYGLWPAWLMTGAALAALGLSFLLPGPLKNCRRPCAYLVLTFALGSGLIHAGLKDYWGRPRPRQVLEFGGSQPFRAYYQPSIGHQPEPSKSFPCGHASSGFCFFAVALLGSVYHSRLLYWIGLGFAWGLGGLLSIARIVQGGHFLSDTLASALIMWLTGWALAYAIFGKSENGIISKDHRADTSFPGENSGRKPF